MGVTTCHACKRHMYVDATICPHCHTRYGPEDVAANVANLKLRRTIGGVGCLIILAIIGSVLLMGYFRHLEMQAEAVTATP